MTRRIPRPGRRVRGSATGRPIMALLDLLGQRWTLRILWELRDGTPLNFRELQQCCERISPTVQNDRLAALRQAAVVEHSANEGYRLTPEGQRLVQRLSGLNEWAENWAKRLARKS